MNPAFFIPAIGQSAASLLGYFLRKKKPRYESTARGKYLMGLSRYGKYSPRARRSILGGVSRSTGNVAQQQKASIRGLLASRGLGESISGISLLSEPEIRRMAALANVEERLGRESELSKAGAREAFAAEKAQSEEQRRLEEQQARMSLLQGLTGAAGQAYQGYQLGKLAGIETKGPGGEVIKPYKPLATAVAAGMKIPSFGYKYFIEQPEKSESGMPDISGMSEEEAERAILLWMLSGGGR